MATFEETYTLRERGLGKRIRRDLRVALALIKMLWVWLTVARRVRRAYRAKEAAGEIYWIDGVARGYEGKR